MKKELDLKSISKAQKVRFLKSVAEKGSNFKPFIERIKETFIIQETGLYKSKETGNILSLEQIRAIENDYFIVIIDLLSSKDHIPNEIQLIPYSLENYLLYPEVDLS